MVSIVVTILITLLLIFLGNFFSKVLIARLIKDNENFESFIKHMLHKVYAMTFVCFAIWLVFGEASVFTIAYFASILIGFARLDFQDARENYDEARKTILNALKE